MADEKNTFSARLRIALFGAGAMIFTVIAVGLSQPHFALASLKGEACLTDDADATTKNGFYTRAAFAKSHLNSEGEQLFWNALTKSWLTDEQAHLLQLAYQVGYEDGGHEHAELMQAILLQESIAGELGRIGHMTAPVGKRSYGVMQVKVSAARDMLQLHRDFGRFRSDEELIVGLMTDDEFNIRIASKFMLYLRENTASTEAALVAYNIGLRGSKSIAKPHSFKYVQRVERNKTEVVRNFNKKFIETDMRVAMR